MKNPFWIAISVIPFLQLRLTYTSHDRRIILLAIVYRGWLVF